jgi:hypothetical protein
MRVMPAKDRYHETVKRALLKAGWTISREQVRLSFGTHNLWVDIQAESLEGQRVILVEVKELYDVPSPVEALAKAIGKYLLYRVGLSLVGNDTPLYLAITEDAYNGIMAAEIGQHATSEFNISLLVFDPQSEEITRWLP